MNQLQDYPRQLSFSDVYPDWCDSRHGERPPAATIEHLDEWVSRYWAHAPFVAVSPAEGLQRVRVPSALQWPYVAPNSSVMHWQVVVDVDRYDGIDAVWSSRVPPPTWCVETATAGHCHAGWVLSAPVCKTNAAKLAPLELLARLEETLIRRLRADRSYAGVIGRNPAYLGSQTIWGPLEPYSMTTLKAALGLSGSISQRYWMKANSHTETAGLGRNCSLFELVRHDAYRDWRRLWSAPDGAEQLAKVTLSRALQLNSEHFGAPLSTNEVSHIAKSISRWTARNMTATRFSEIQRQRGIRSGHARRAFTRNELFNFIEENA